MTALSGWCWTITPWPARVDSEASNDSNTTGTITARIPTTYALLQRCDGGLAGLRQEFSVDDRTEYCVRSNDRGRGTVPQRSDRIAFVLHHAARKSNRIPTAWEQPR